MTRVGSFCLAATVAILGPACGDDDDDTRVQTAEQSSAAATAYGTGTETLTREDLEAGRLDPSWRQYVERNRAARSGDGSPDPRGWDEISPETVNSPARGFPIHGDVEGPSVARVQILLDLNRFSPGAIDGRWGKNTEKAVYWFQEFNGLEATGEVDEQTMQALERGAGGDVVRSHTITEADISGPYRDLPEDIYERADESCLCYESRREQVGEVFHATPELIERLNPDVDLSSVDAGQSLAVPAVETFHLEELPDGQYAGGGEVARIVISDGGSYLHALDEAGEILYHFPSTLGADYSPSPRGEYTVESITFDPTWHYQPEILQGVDPSEDDAVLPAGPNNAVGIVWMALSEPHYGIHGTSAPETIGYATSNGCVRLTNWDAGFLAQRVAEDTDVEFRDVTGRD